MRNRHLTLFLILIATFSLYSPAQAASDIPMLTWERGKEQNIVLGGYTNQASWKIRLVDEKNEELDFANSRTDKNGYIVYSIILPDDLPTGAYRIETVSLANEVSVVAGVNVVEASYFEIVRAPIQLLLILLSLIILISTLSTIRVRKYQELSYLQSASTATLPKPVDSFYRLRRGALVGVNNSLFKHLLVREGEVLHKLSPILWALAPVATFLIGSFSGIVTGTKLGIADISIYVFVGMAVFGILDPYSGFTGIIGFSVLQAMQGDVSSIRSVCALIALGFSWMAPGLFATLYREVFSKEWPSKLANSILPSLAASLIGAFSFYSLEVLTNSLLDRVGPISNSGYMAPIIIAFAIYFKDEISRVIDKRGLLSGKNLEVKTIILTRVVAPKTVGLLFLFLSGVLYTWTQYVSFSLVAAAFIVFPLLLLQVRFASPTFKLFSKLQRSVLLESTIVTLVFLASFYFIQNLPQEALAKGRFIVIAAIIPLIIHSIYSSLSDTQDRSLVEVR